mmetsp:Transcript_26304/g.60587  ORF Transcript_26304/g.60587 Transcript_26304/m.60587 type:complete len:260 (-) Transcript_26304:632-1411(-)
MDRNMHTAVLSLGDQMISKLTKEEFLFNILPFLQHIRDLSASIFQVHIEAFLLSHIVSILTKCATRLKNYSGIMDLSGELFKLLKLSENTNIDDDDLTMSEVQIATVTSIGRLAEPRAGLDALGRWNPPRFGVTRPTTLALRKLLRRSAVDGLKDEFSGSLLRIRQARQVSRGKIGHSYDVASSLSSGGRYLHGLRTREPVGSTIPFDNKTIAQRIHGNDEVRTSSPTQMSGKIDLGPINSSIWIRLQEIKVKIVKELE